MTYNVLSGTLNPTHSLPNVKMENNNPQKVPLPLHGVCPHLIQQCLGPPHGPPQTAAPTVEALSHKVPIGYNGAPQMRPQKYPFPWTDRQIPLPALCLDRPTYDAKRHPDPIRRFSTIHWTDRETDRPADRQIVHGKV